MSSYTMTRLSGTLNFQKQVPPDAIILDGTADEA